jgi:hypothetical protein
MFGLYPAGAQWTRHFTANVCAREIQQSLVSHGGFTAGIFHQPFGSSRGAVTAQKGNFLVLAAHVDDQPADLVVVPSIELQNLLWSFERGLASQWSAGELRALTGCNGWDALLSKAAADFAAVGDTVNAAIDGTLVKPVEPPRPDRVVAASFPDDDDVPWLPSDYLHDAAGPEVPTCAL